MALTLGCRAVRSHRMFSPSVVKVRKMAAASIQSYCDIKFSEDKSSMSVTLPGWSLDDINLIYKDLTQKHYLRTVKVFSKWEQLREIAKGQGFMDIMNLENSEATYMKCVNLERKVSHEELVERFGRSPYAYGLQLESKIGKMGRSSFQIDNKVVELKSGTELFVGSLIYVIVDYKTTRPIPIPSWWAEKVKQTSAASTVPALKVDLRKPKGVEKVLHQCSFLVRPSEVDRFGHTNNLILNSLCADALLDSYSKGQIPAITTVEQFESAMKRIEVDYVSGSSGGDTVTAVVSLDSLQPNRIFCRLYKQDVLICALAQEYDENLGSGHEKAKI